MARTFILTQRLVCIFGIIHALQWVIPDFLLSPSPQLSLGIRPLRRRVEEKEVAAHLWVLVCWPHVSSKFGIYKKKNLNFLPSSHHFCSPWILIAYKSEITQNFKLAGGRDSCILRLSLGHTDLNVSTEIQRRSGCLSPSSWIAIPLRRNPGKELSISQPTPS